MLFARLSHTRNHFTVPLSSGIFTTPLCDANGNSACIEGLIRYNNSTTKFDYNAKMKFLKLFLLCSLFVMLHAREDVPDKVTLQLQWKHQFEFAGFYAAKEKCQARS